MSPGTNRDWVCCQIGAREHYAIPRGLHRQGRLECLYTDAWVLPESPLKLLPGHTIRRLSKRFDKELASGHIHHFTFSLLLLEVQLRLRTQASSWEKVMKRNEWFQNKVVTQLVHSGELHTEPNRSNPVVFCYSYAAKEILRTATKLGCSTVLGQIDAGPVAEDIVAHESAKHTQLNPVFQHAPDSYWDAWRVECELADHIVVNSVWSREALVRTGIDPRKLVVIPLIYKAPEALREFHRDYPEEFSVARPLRVLFLGALIIRKGIAQMLEAARQLQNVPVEFWFVGYEGVELPEELKGNSSVHWVGPVPRSKTHYYYRMCDLFVFPTLSDGFGLTQLEAQSWGLPVIASQFCGDVVRHGENGIVLDEVSGDAIADSISWCLAHPDAVKNMSQRSRKIDECFGEASVIQKLFNCISDD